MSLKDRKTEGSALQQLLVQMAISEYSSGTPRWQRGVCPYMEISENFLFYDVIAMELYVAVAGRNRRLFQSFFDTYFKASTLITSVLNIPESSNLIFN